LLERAEHFVALIRYGLRMLGDEDDFTAQPSLEGMSEGLNCGSSH